MALRGAEPIVIPDDVWRREEYRRVLADCDLGGLLRLVHARGISETRIAAAIGISQGSVNDYIRRKSRAEKLDLFKRAADGLNMPDHARLLLGLAPAQRTVTIETTPTVPARPNFAPTDGHSDPEDQDVHRRTLLAAFATAGQAMALAASHGIESLRHNLIAALGGDSSDLVDWQIIASQYARTYATTPPEQFLTDLAADLLVAQDRYQKLHDDTSRAEMQRVIAQLAVFMAHTLSNMANFRASRRWWRVARGCADQTRDNELRMWVYGREVIGALYERRDPDSVLALADVAARFTEVPGMGTGTVLIGRAQALALKGSSDHARSAMSTLYQIVDHLPNRVTSDTDSLFGWPEHRLRHGESFVYAHIGDADQADKAQQRALALYPIDMVRERAQIRLHQALAMARVDPSSAAIHATHILDELPATQRTQVVIEVARSVVHAIPASEHRRPQVNALNEILSLPAAATVQH
jgi:transcriptional regulator with XRE-family HTH domain